MTDSLSVRQPSGANSYLAFTDFSRASGVVGEHLAWSRSAITSTSGGLRVGQGARQPEWAALSQELQRLSSLKTGWDSDRGVRPSPLVIDRIRRAAAALEEGGVVDVPELSIASDGEVGLDWLSGETAASLSFLANRTIYGYAYRPEMNEPWRLTAQVYPEAAISALIAILRCE